MLTLALARLEEEGTCHFLSLTKLSRHKHFCCPISVVEVQDRLENLTISCLS